MFDLPLSHLSSLIARLEECNHYINENLQFATTINFSDASEDGYKKFLYWIDERSDITKELIKLLPELSSDERNKCIEVLADINAKNEKLEETIALFQKQIREKAVDNRKAKKSISLYQSHSGK